MSAPAPTLTFHSLLSLASSAKSITDNHYGRGSVISRPPVGRETMSTTVEDFAEFMRMDLHDYLTELRIEPQPEVMLAEDLEEWQLACFLDETEVAPAREFLTEYIQSLFETQTEKFTDSDRWAEFEPESNPPYKKFAQDLWPRKTHTVFFTEESAGSSRELFNRESPEEKITRVLITSIGYFDLDRTAAVHSAWLKASAISVQGRPKLKVGMLLVDLQSGEVECKVFRCGQHWHLAHGDREFAEFQILKMFAHLGEHDDPRNPWPKFKGELEKLRWEDSDELKLARRSLTLWNQKKAALTK